MDFVEVVGHFVFWSRIDNVFIFWSCTGSPIRVAALIAELARFVQSGAAFIAMRAVIGCGLATFVCCQVWCSQQFSKNVVR